MKKGIILIFILCLFLAGCGAGTQEERAPYITGAEREALEQNLLDSIVISESSGTSRIISLSNDSEWDLDALSLYSPETHMSLIYLARLPAHTSTALSIYSQNFEKDAELSYKLGYTIGEYRYGRDNIALDFSGQNSEKLINLTGDAIYLETVDGDIPLVFGGTIEFPNGDEFPDLKTIWINSISVSSYYSDGNYLSLAMEMDADFPSSGNATLVAKLFDENDIIRDVEDYSTYSNGISFFSHGIEPGIYYIRLEEIRDR